MTMRSAIARALQQEHLNFVLTNCLPRRRATEFMGWFSKIEQPLVRDLSIGAWRFFADVDLDDAKKARFTSLHDAFVRELRAGARLIDRDPAVLASPCDAIVGACGRIDGDTLLQAKGRSYTLAELLGDPALARLHRDGRYVTLRLTAGMYHRFHAPADGRIRRVTYIAGDAWNVNRASLARVDRLYCRNERGVLPIELDCVRDTVTLVPVAAILVASIRLHFLDVLLHLKHAGPTVMPCDAAVRKGEEMGWFQHGSTIIVLAPGRCVPCHGVTDGAQVRMGQPLLHFPSGASC